MTVLSAKQIESFQRDGYLMLANIVGRGENTGRVRCNEYEMLFPEVPGVRHFLNNRLNRSHPVDYHKLLPRPNILV